MKKRAGKHARPVVHLFTQDYKYEGSTGGKRYGRLLKRALSGKLVSQDIRIGLGCYQFMATCHQDGPYGTDPLVLLLTNTTWTKRKVVARYRIRWCTQPLFRHLKSNGFALEAIGFESRQKIRLMVAMVVVL